MSLRPIVIAHRGASGYLPEHTLEAKILAYGFGADYLEQDVVASRDGVLIVLHDLYLDDVTNVVERFPERRRADGRYYVVDFDLAELRELDLIERRRAGTRAPLHAGRYSGALPRFRIATLDEELELVRALNRATGRTVGIYPEIKHPGWHREHGIDLSRLLIDRLAAYGYSSADDAVFVQCFDAGELRRVREVIGSRLELVQLIDAHDAAHREHLTPRGLARIKEYANTIGPPYAALVDVTRGKPEPSAFAAAARQAELGTHAYTFRREQVPDYAGSFVELLRFFCADIGLDGLFTDQPDLALGVRTELEQLRR